MPERGYDTDYIDQVVDRVDAQFADSLQRMIARAQEMGQELPSELHQLLSNLGELASVKLIAVVQEAYAAGQREGFKQGVRRMIPVLAALSDDPEWQLAMASGEGRD